MLKIYSVTYCPLSPYSKCSGAGSISVISITSVSSVFETILLNKMNIIGASKFMYWGLLRLIFFAAVLTKTCVGMARSLLQILKALNDADDTDFPLST